MKEQGRETVFFRNWFFGLKDFTASPTMGGNTHFNAPASKESIFML